MAVTILEALQNAEINVEAAVRNPRLGGFTLILAQQQLHNAVTLLTKGYGLHELIDPLIEKYEPVESAPEKDEVPNE